MTSRLPAALLVTALTAASGLLAAASAEAAGPKTLYTNPHGGVTNCSQTDPCDIGTAFDAAVTGDTIDLAPGTYGSNASPIDSGLLMGQTGITVKDQTASVPIVYSSAGAGVSLTANSSITGLVLYYTGSKAGLAVATGAVANRVSVIGHTTGLSCVISGTLTNSLCLNTEAASVGAAGFGGNNVTLSPVFRGDTIEATGTDSYGIKYALGASATVNVSITNTIVHGSADDILASTADPTATVIIDTNHSDYASSSATSDDGTATITSGAGNISTAPKFVDPAKNNYAEKAGSATINTGAADTSADTDLLMHPRAIGGAPDMGALEFLVPPVFTKPIVTVGRKSAKVTLKCNPEGVLGSVFFKAKVVKPPKGFKGKKSVKSAAQPLPAVAKQVPVTLTLLGLTRKTKYSIVVVATNQAGTAISKPIKITTK